MASHPPEYGGRCADGKKAAKREAAISPPLVPNQSSVGALFHINTIPEFGGRPGAVYASVQRKATAILREGERNLEKEKASFQDPNPI